MARAQGSLEYLVIIAIVLAISSVVMLYATGIIGTQKSSVSTSTCKQASIDCKLSKMSSPTDQCDQCDAACKDSTTGIEIFSGATLCCKAGKTDMIYAGTPGCSSVPVQKELFYDEFANLNAWTGDIIGVIYWHVVANGYSQSNSAYLHSYSAWRINHTQSTVGYNYIQVSFWAFPDFYDVGEWMKVDWSADGGITWNNLYTAQHTTSWVYNSYSLPATANNNPNFKVGVYCYDWHSAGAESCAIDVFRIIGTQI